MDPILDRLKKILLKKKYSESQCVEGDCQRILDWCERNQTEILFPLEYSLHLQQIPLLPDCLFFRGNREVLNRSFIAIVGARKASTYGLAAAFKVARKMALSGMGVVSGLARGVDGASHRGALSCQGITLAVMGAGLATIYPREHKKLAHQILDQGGGWLSEFPPFVPPYPQNFPQRNRIISGLALGTLVIEARQRSGSLITALSSLEQGREVFVLPGPVHQSNFEGGHQLIQQGAKLVFRVQDIFDELSLNSSVEDRNPLTLHQFKFGEVFTLSQWIYRLGGKSESLLRLAIQLGQILPLGAQRFVFASGFDF